MGLRTVHLVDKTYAGNDSHSRHQPERDKSSRLMYPESTHSLRIGRESAADLGFPAVHPQGDNRLVPPQWLLHPFPRLFACPWGRRQFKWFSHLSATNKTHTKVTRCSTSIVIFGMVSLFSVHLKTALWRQIPRRGESESSAVITFFSTEQPCDTKSNLMLSQAKQDSIETLFGYRWGETGYISLYMALDDDASTPKKEKERFELNISN